MRAKTERLGKDLQLQMIFALLDAGGKLGMALV